MKYDIAIILPTFNEVENIEILISSLKTVLQNLRWEAIIVDDDSPDRTFDIAFTLSEKEPNVRCIRRVGRRGLSSAIIEGMMATNAQFIAVMDADLQHDESVLLRMINEIINNDLEIVIASRFIGESKLEDYSASREKLSNLGNYLAHKVLKTNIKDPLSGYFIVKRELINELVHSLSGKGFKILLDIFSSSKRPLKYKEIPFVFRKRHAGESKLDTLVGLEFITLLIDKFFGEYLPLRYITFVFVGLFGLITHLIFLGLFFKIFKFHFILSQALATVAAMTINFYLNNIFTYRDKRLKNIALMKGLLTFYMACSIGALVNFAVAFLLYEKGLYWIIAGLLGGVISSVWNYATTSTITWKK